MNEIDKFELQREGLLLFKPKSAKRQKISSAEYLEESSNNNSKLITHVENGNVRLQSPEKIDGPLVIPVKSLDQQAQDEILADLLGGNNNNNKSTAKIEITTSSNKNKPLLARLGQRNQGDTDEDRFQRDLESVAKDMDFRSEVYDQIPVEAFGAALLRGMGWKESSSSSSDNNKDAKDKQTTMTMSARPQRLGLGAVSKEVLVNNNKSEQQRVFGNGSLVWIHIYEPKRRGEVIQWSGVPGLDQVRIRLEGSSSSSSSEEVIRKRDLSLVSNQELLDKPFNFFKPNDDVVVVKKEEKKSSSSVHHHHQTGTGSSTGLVDWLHVGIRVSLCGKGLGGRGIVLDVVSRGEASIRLDDSGKVLGRVKESNLVALRPSVGHLCLILMGEYKGQRGTLLEEGVGGEVWVQLEDDLEVVKTKITEVAVVGL